MQKNIIKIVIFLSVLLLTLNATPVYITTGSFDKNAQNQKAFCKKSNSTELQSLLSKYSCKNTGLIRKKYRKMEWYKCNVNNQVTDFLATYTSTSFACKTSSIYALSKQKEYKDKAIPSQKKYFLSMGSLYEDKASKYCMEIQKDKIRTITNQLDCADYTSKIGEYTRDIEFYKCEKGKDVYITKGVSGIQECKSTNKKIAKLSDPNADKEFITFGVLNINQNSNLQSYCKQNNLDMPVLNFLEKELSTSCKEDVFSPNIEYTNNRLKKYRCGSKIVHITKVGTRDKCVQLNAQVEKEIIVLENKYIAKQDEIARKKALEVEIARKKAEKEELERQEVARKKKIADEQLAFAQSKGFSSYTVYEQDLAQKAEAKRLAKIEAIKKAEENVSSDIKNHFKYLPSKRFCKSTKDITCNALNTVYEEYSNRNVSTGWMYCKNLKVYETLENNRKIMMANRDIIRVCKYQLDQFMQYNMRQYGKGGIGNQDFIDMNWITNRVNGKF